MKPKAPLTTDDPKIGFYLAAAVTEYDRRQEAAAMKRGHLHNVYALSHYLEAVNQIEEKIKRGADMRAAILDHVNGRLANAVLRGAGLPGLTAEEARR
jgi:hypothetical protein